MVFGSCANYLERVGCDDRAVMGVQPFCGGVRMISRVALIFQLAVALASFLIANVSAAEGPALSIGLALPLSGDMARYGLDIRRGATMVKEELAKRGTEMVFISEDTQLIPRTAATAAQKLINRDRVDVIVSLWDTAEAVAPIAEQKGVPHVSIRWNHRVAQEFSHTFTFESTYVSWIRATLAYLQSQRVRRLAVMTDISGAGWVLSQPSTPVAECVDVLPGGELLAHWGYQNNGSGEVLISAADNFFSPGDRQRGQPSTFARGRVLNAFTTTFPSTGTLTWSLGGATATASISTVRCEGEDALECTENDDGDNLAQLDNLATKQRAEVVNLLKGTIKLAKGNSSGIARANRLIDQARRLYLEQWTGIWSNFSKVTVVCVGIGCASIDKATAISGINARSSTFVSLARSSAALAKKLSRGRLARVADATVATTRRMNREVQEKSAQLPRFESKCQ